MSELLCAALFAMNGILRLYLGITEARGFEFALAAVWLLGAAIWFRRFLRKNKNGEVD